MGVNSLPKTVTRQRRGYDLNPGLTAPESSTLTTRLPSHPSAMYTLHNKKMRKLISTSDSAIVTATAVKFAAVARPERDINRLLHGTQQRGVRMRVVPRCQRT